MKVLHIINVSQDIVIRMKEIQNREVHLSKIRMTV